MKNKELRRVPNYLTRTNQVLKIGLLIIAMLCTFTASASAQCLNAITVTDVTNPPKVTNLSCLLFSSNIVTIPANLYKSNGFIVGVDASKVVTVGNEAFYRCAIASLYLPEVKTVGNNAFQRNFITRLDFQKLETIGINAFAGNEINYLDLPKIETIGNGAFFSNSLTTLFLKSAVTIGDGAFSANKIATIDLPQAVTIGDYAFDANKVSSIKMPKAEAIGNYAFWYNPIAELSLQKLISIGDYAFFECCLYDDATNTYSSTTLKVVELPNIKSIGSYAFANNPNLQYVFLNADLPSDITAGSNIFQGSGQPMIVLKNQKTARDWYDYIQANPSSPWSVCKIGYGNTNNIRTYP